MTMQVEVNVMVDNVRWNAAFGWYTGRFIFQQVAPLSPIIVHKGGDINLKTAQISEPVEIVYHWLSNAVEIQGELYPAEIADPPADSFWVLPGSAKPKASDLPPVGNGDITVGAGPNPKKLVLTDNNAPNRLYTYCLALRVGIDGGQWLVADPKIVNTGTTRLFSYSGTEQAN